jgi:hypothetical protein
MKEDEQTRTDAPDAARAPLQASDAASDTPASGHADAAELGEAVTLPNHQAQLPLPPWKHLTRRQLLTGAGVAVGVVALGGGTLLALRSGVSAGSEASVTSAASPTNTPLPLPPGTPVPEQTLHAWRTRQLTAQPTQRFRHHTGASLVPLGIVEPTYPNPYNPYTAHLHGYLLGGALVTNQLFWYVGLEAEDGTQFVGKLRVGPVDQAAPMLSPLVTQQSTDDIEGGPADDPQVTISPRTLYQALPALAGHCVVVALTPQPLPSDADGVSSELRAALNQQATISDHFLRFDFAVVHQTPFAQVSPSQLDPIRSLIDTTPIRYHTAADGVRYPVITQLTLRHSDQLFSKLVAHP